MARQLDRAVLRPRVRARGHAALHAALPAPDDRGRRPDGVPAAGRLVGLDLHDLGDELVRPGSRPGARCAGARHAREHAGRGGDPGRVRRPGAAAGRRLRGHPVDPQRLHGAGHRPARPAARAARADPRVDAVGRRDLAGRRACARAGGEARVTLWLVALACDYAGPVAGHWTPGLGRSHPSDWELEPAHFAERLMLFLIIALGETIVAAGVTASRV